MDRITIRVRVSVSFQHHNRNPNRKLILLGSVLHYLLKVDKFTYYLLEIGVCLPIFRVVDIHVIVL